MGPVVQSWISANSWLEFNPLFRFVYFCLFVCFKTFENKISIHPDTRFLEKDLQVYNQTVGEIALKIFVDLSRVR
jgi:hypothetical protein